ncbi:MAG TPA: DUF5320 domain-containing protein [Verrucomicrobiota bacterium]|nr:DUF5320 domain-containing protein [Verrucomicrobiota bacterium]HOK76469.1 DUF5320 domain-containing protein [Verrucomicrobiota bacterium]
MPLGDRTGPMGQGPMTGRAAGYCAGFGTPGYLNRGPGFGYGHGWGRGGGRGWGGGGRGWRHWFYATGLTGWQRAAVGLPPFVPPPPGPAWSPEAELAQLRQQAEFLQKALDGVQQRINQLAGEGSKSQTDNPGAAS